MQRAREAAKIQVTQPKTPAFKTKTRILGVLCRVDRFTKDLTPCYPDRHKFDDSVKDKERIVIRLREAKRQEEQEREKQALKEFRKELDAKVKANPVPEWVYPAAD